ncbi:MAG: Plasmid maintenance system killer protein [Lentisphaerae bacterium ADurb.Bin242]|nr:MAG: Plasmid maintenance system killer protein [Lentisphaerae bacterium ADurb.Bin242]
MIVSFRHKGLKLFYEAGDMRGIQAKHAAKLQDILDALDGATCADDMRLPGFKLHLLNPHSARVFSVWVSGNWRVTFRLTDRGAEIVDYLDYH